MWRKSSCCICRRKIVKTLSTPEYFRFIFRIEFRCETSPIFLKNNENIRIVGHYVFLNSIRTRTLLNVRFREYTFNPNPPPRRCVSRVAPTHPPPIAAAHHAPLSSRPHSDHSLQRLGRPERVLRFAHYACVRTPEEYTRAPGYCVYCWWQK